MERNVMMRVIFIALLLAGMCLLAACGHAQPDVDEEGNMLYLSQDEIKENLRDGIFVLHEDGTLSPVSNLMQGYSGELSEDDGSLGSRFLWYTNNELNITATIPEVNKKNKLVLIYNSTSDIPAVFTLEKYAFKGYSIGCHISRGQDDTLYLNTDDTLSGSHAEYVLASLPSRTFFEISKINKSEELPVGNIDNKLQLFLGLDKDKYYEFEFYQGTYYETETIQADTLVFQSEDVTVLNNPYKKTANGYFTVSLPDNIDEGYYYICGLGMFKYTK